MDENGYPTGEELLAIEDWDLADIEGLFSFVEPFFEQYGTFKRKDNFIKITTGGWSGCEDVLNSLQHCANGVVWMMTWVMDMRGGLYVFQLPSKNTLMTVEKFCEDRRKIDDRILDVLNQVFE